eukprot:12651316-Prorocentrum_lima.AAC.1
MTSSLVGSEMCIRDRASNAGQIWMVLADTPSAAAEVAGTSSGTTPSPRPVSYTHLTLPTICSV